MKHGEFLGLKSGNPVFVPGFYECKLSDDDTQTLPAVMKFVLEPFAPEDGGDVKTFA